MSRGDEVNLLWSSDDRTAREGGSGAQQLLGGIPIGADEGGLRPMRRAVVVVQPLSYVFFSFFSLSAVGGAVVMRAVLFDVRSEGGNV